MAERKAIGKKLRFEVFKRDKFQCQYCGAKAPDVVLQCDHINPVSKGGENELLNLITSCKDCNAGKSDRLLDDQSTLEKQREQLAELEERRQQLEAMLEWRDELSRFDDEVVAVVVAHWISLTPGFSVNEQGILNFRKWLGRFEIQEVLDAMDISSRQYLRYGKDSQLTHDSVNTARS